MKKILTTAAVMAVVLTAACGCGKKSAPVETTEAPKTAGEFVIPDNWDGVTFTSETLAGITIVAPETGWECQQDELGSFVIVKDDDLISYQVIEFEDENKINKDEDKIKKVLSLRDDLLDFELNEAEDGTVTYKYTAQSKDDSKMNRVSYNDVKIVGKTETIKRAATQKGDNARLEELKKSLDSNITVE